MPFFISCELKLVDANQNAMGSAVAATLTFARAPDAATDGLIRLYELLKNDSRSLDQTPKRSPWIAWVSD